DHPSTLNLKNTFANNYLESGRDFAEPSRLKTAIDLHRQNLQKYEQTLTVCDPNTRRSALNLVNAYIEADRAADAIALAERVLAQIEQELGSSDARTRDARVALARAYAGGGRTSAAQGLIDQAIAELPFSSDPDDEEAWFFRLSRAEILLQAG